MADKPYKDPDVLTRLYHEEDMTQTEIADKLGVEQTTIYRWMKNLDIQSRTPSESREVRGTSAGPKVDGPHTDEEWLREKYFDEKLTITEMAELAPIESEVSIMRWMDKYGIDRRPQEVTRALRNPGAGFVHADDGGYETIRTSVDDKSKYVKVHRLVAMAHYGIEEVKDSIIHHKNRIPWDNRPDNLELMDSQSEHARHHDFGKNGVRENIVRDEETGRFIG